MSCLETLEQIRYLMVMQSGKEPTRIILPEVFYNQVMMDLSALRIYDQSTYKVIDSTNNIELRYCGILLEKDIIDEPIRSDYFSSKI
jgi:hypothetical protein